jgi:hypothetical protein
MRPQCFEVELRPPVAQHQARGNAHEHVDITSDIHVGLLVLEVPDRKIRGDARFLVVVPHRLDRELRPAFYGSG